MNKKYRAFLVTLLVHSSSSWAILPLNESQQAKQKVGSQKVEQAPMANINTTTLIIDVSETCALRINGEDRGTLKPDEAKVITVGAGEQLIECASTKNPNSKARIVKTLNLGSSLVVYIQIPQQIRPQQIERFTIDAGSIKDIRGGLLWQISDNGEEIDWSEANSICRNIAGGWKLPSVDELLSIFDQSQSTTCGPETCLTFSKFKLSGFWFWSNQQDSATNAWYVGLHDGSKGSSNKNSKSFKRALCVRRP
jgi:hypothetical protein